MSEPAQDWLSEFAQESPEANQAQAIERAGTEDWFSEFAEESRLQLHLVRTAPPTQLPIALSESALQNQIAALGDEPRVWFGRPTSIELHVVVVTALFWLAAIGVIQFYGRAAPAPNSETAEHIAIQSVLARYRRAFDQLKEQSFTFDSCKIAVDGQRADASCSGTASVVPKVAGNNLREEPRLWTFRLQRVNGQWLIDTVESHPGQR